jgi:hypothetical protein
MPPPPQWHRRRRWRRSLLLAGLIAVAGSAVWWGPPVGGHVMLLRLQRRCMSYTQPSGHVAYIAEGGGIRNPRTGTAADFVPYQHALPEWEKLYAAIAPPGMHPSASVFVHERRNSRGESRLVAVNAVHWTAGLRSCVLLDARTVRPGTPFAKPALLRWTTAPDYLIEDVGRIMTGRPDPGDASHFTIECEIAGRRNTLDGWLRDDDVVVIEPRDPLLVLTPPPPASPASLPSGGPAAAGPASRASR